MTDADAVLDDGFQKALARIAKLRLTPKEFRETHTDLTYMAYWRALKGVSKAPARTKVLRALEEALDAVEKEKAIPGSSPGTASHHRAGGTALKGSTGCQPHSKGQWP